MDLNSQLKPFVWNVTYNDPQRWQEVYAISGARMAGLKGVSETLRGRAIGSPVVQLTGCHGLDVFQNLIQTQANRMSLNFMRTKEGIIGFCKVRLEVYAIPIRHGEWKLEMEPSGGTQPGETIILTCARKGQRVHWQVSGPPEVIRRFTSWLEMAKRS